MPFRIHPGEAIHIIAECGEKGWKIVAASSLRPLIKDRNRPLGDTSGGSCEAVGMRRKQRTDAVVVDRSDQELEALLLLYLERDDDAFEAVSTMSAYDPDQCWRFLEIARRADLSEPQLAFLSAGPFEDMLKRHGREFIGRVEEAAHADPRMRVLVATVWRAGVSDELWDRILALRTRLGVAPL